MRDLKIQLRMLKAKLNAQQGFCMNKDMEIQAVITEAEIKELKIIIKETR